MAALKEDTMPKYDSHLWYCLSISN